MSHSVQGSMLPHLVDATRLVLVMELDCKSGHYKISNTAKRPMLLPSMKVMEELWHVSSGLSIFEIQGDVEEPISVLRVNVGNLSSKSDRDEYCRILALSCSFT